MTMLIKAVRKDRRSWYDGKTKWQVGRIVRPDVATHRVGGPCGHGIHAGKGILGAVKYQGGPSIYAEVIPARGAVLLGEDNDKVRYSAMKPIRWLEREEIDSLAGFKLWEANNPVNPLLLLPTQGVTEHDVAMLSLWASVRASMRDSVRASVWVSMWASAGDSVWASAGDSVWASVRASVWDSVRASVRASVGDSVWDRVWDSVGAYIGGLFPAIETWKYAESLGPDPWRPLLHLWYRGFVPSFDGTTWRLHAGKKAKIVYEWRP